MRSQKAFFDSHPNFAQDARMNEDHNEWVEERNSSFIKRVCAVLLVLITGIVLAPLIIALGILAMIRRR